MIFVSSFAFLLLSVVSGNRLVGFENKVFIYVNLIPLSLLAEQALRCQMLSNRGQGDTHILLIVLLP